LWFFPNWEKSRDATAAPAVRNLLAAYADCAPDAVHVERGEHGKPRLLNARLEFNLSHAGNALLLGLSRDVALGVDLELATRPLRSIVELAQRWFAPREADALAALAETQRHAAFLRMWTCKEAVLKRLGHGISFGLHRVEFELTAAGEVQGVTEAPNDVAAWQVVELAPDVAHFGALAWYGKSVVVRAFVMQGIAAATQSG
jgi:4'-phosphopantetheinyl transferase